MRGMNDDVKIRYKRLNYCAPLSDCNSAKRVRGQRSFMRKRTLNLQEKCVHFGILVPPSRMHQSCASVICCPLNMPLPSVCIAGAAALLVACAGKATATALATNAAPAPANLTIFIDAASPIARVDPEYISFNLDWHTPTEEDPAWTANSSVLTVNLHDPWLLDLVGALAPAHLRIGGSEGDDAWYETSVTPTCPPSNASWAFCLTAQRWAALNDFAAATGVTLLFGLNAMSGRANSSAPQDLTMIRGFIAATAAAGYTRTLAAFEYGNELEKLGPAVYGRDYLRVRAVIDADYAFSSLRPLLVGPDININNAWAKQFWAVAAPALNATTYHMYIGYGLDPTLPQSAWNYTFLVQSLTQGRSVVAAAAAASLRIPLWIGETALAWHSGRNGTTNTFSSGPWMVTQLGHLAQLGHTVQCRQTLRGGYYELIDKFTGVPNPDYWTTRLWKATMGRGVLNTSVGMAGGLPLDVFAFAHCTAGAVNGSVTLAYVNLSPGHAYTVNATAMGGASGAAIPLTPRGEYLLTASSLTSSVVKLNGAPLTYNGPGTGPALTPVWVDDPLQALVIPPRSYGFVVLPDAGAAACRS